MKSVGSSPYFLMFSRDPIFQSRHQPQLELSSDPFDEEMQVFLNQRDQSLKRVMPLAMRNLAITQQRDKERINLVRGGGWSKPKASFAPEDYVLLKQETNNTLNVRTTLVTVPRGAFIPTRALHCEAAAKWYRDPGGE